MRTTKAPCGHTLFEMTTIICICSILMATAFNSFKDYIKREHARIAINRMAGAVSEARALALSHRTIVTLCPNEGGVRCQGDWEGELILFIGRADNDDADIISRYAALKQGTLAWRSFRQDNFLEMQGNGLTLAQNGSFVYCPPDGNERFAHALILNKSGRARVAIDSDNDGIKELRPKVAISC